MIDKVKKLRDYWVIRVSGMFDRTYYKLHNPDIAEVGCDPIWHFVCCGWKESRNPSPTFDVSRYLSVNADVRQAGINPLVHFIRYGLREERLQADNLHLIEQIACLRRAHERLEQEFQVLQQAHAEQTANLNDLLSKCEFVAPGHYFSAVPSWEERNAFTFPDGDTVPGIDMNAQAQAALLGELEQYRADCPFRPEPQSGMRYYFNNNAFCARDGFILHAMIRHFKPKRIIEVGSGYSSCAILDTNEHFFGNKIDLTFIEPYPELLYSLMRENDRHHTVHPHKVQDVELSCYDQLQKNDILFIDSTHVCKLNSDVNHELFQVLPRLAPGVIIHFHDVFYPFEYPEDWIKGRMPFFAKGMAWNEDYVLRAFLQYNHDFEILFFTDYLHRCIGGSDAADYLSTTGGSLWLRKVR